MNFYQHWLQWKCKIPPKLADIDLHNRFITDGNGCIHVLVVVMMKFYDGGVVVVSARTDGSVVLIVSALVVLW